MRLEGKRWWPPMLLRSMLPRLMPLLTLLLLHGVVACGGEGRGGRDAGEASCDGACFDRMPPWNDGGPGPDAVAGDAPTGDAPAPPDSGADGGTWDAGPRDAGPDGGTWDAGPGDAGPCPGQRVCGMGCIAASRCCTNADCPGGFCPAAGDACVAALSAHDSHPNYWEAAPARWTAKQYVLLPSTTGASAYVSAHGSGLHHTWVWSGPLGPGERALRYQRYRDGVALDIWEWERWSEAAAGTLAVVHQYGGADEGSARPVYASAGRCMSGGATGVTWPDLRTDPRRLAAQSFGSGCDPEWQSGAMPGGYVHVVLREDFGAPGSALRVTRCNSYVPAAVTPNGNAICRTSPSVAFIEQRYSMGPNASPTHGCEATVYAWGDAKDGTDHYRRWFRNGELRWSLYLGIAGDGRRHAPDDDTFWAPQCTRALSEIANWLYTGTYKLDTTEWIDPGDGPP